MERRTDPKPKSSAPQVYRKGRPVETRRRKGSQAPSPDRPSGDARAIDRFVPLVNALPAPVCRHGPGRRGNEAFESVTRGDGRSCAGRGAGWIGQNVVKPRPDGAGYVCQDGQTMAMTPEAFEADIRKAQMHAQAGRLADAEAVYRKLLAQRPADGAIAQRLGLIAFQLGRPDAVALLRRAAAARPDDPVVHANLGHVLHVRGDPEGAIASLQSALRIRPAYAPAHYNLSIVYAKTGRISDAIEQLRAAISADAANAAAHNNLGLLLQQTGRLEESIASFRRAVELSPKLTEAHANLGGALRERGDVKEALTSLVRAVSLAPHDAKLRGNLGAMYFSDRKIDLAVQEFRRAVASLPDDLAMVGNLAVALNAQGEVAEAITLFRRVLEREPDDVRANQELGEILTHLGRVDEALPLLRRVADSGDAARHSALLMGMTYSPTLRPMDLREEAARWSRRWEAPLVGQRHRHENDRDGARRIRVGYVSSNFRTHAIGHFLLPLLEHHDREQVEIVCYSSVRFTDEVTGRFRAQASIWRDVAGRSDEQIAALVRADRVDILVDLGGHTPGNHLGVFVRKPAPVQVSFLGYGGTTGLEAVDYRLTDAWADPPGMTDSFFSEKLWRLAPTAWCYAPPPSPPVRSGASGSGDGVVTFGSASSLAKIGGPVLDAWAQVLRQVPRSRLWLKAYRINSAEIEAMIRREFESRGIEPSRIEPHAANADLSIHLAGYGNVDIALDTFPYCGTTTTCEALWMGVPVITQAVRLSSVRLRSPQAPQAVRPGPPQAGASHIGRVGASLLNNLGLGELIAGDTDEYVKLAVSLAGDNERRVRLRESMRDRMLASPLMNAWAYAREVESAYRAMWQAWCATGAEPPAVPAVSAAEPSPVELPGDTSPAAAHFLTGRAVEPRAEAAQLPAAGENAAELRDALRHEQEGRWADAETIYRRLLALAPDDVEVNHRLGAVAFNLGRADAAEILKRAATARPGDAEIHCNLGRALASRGNAQEAIASFRSALSLRPDYLEAWINLGNIQRQIGQIEPAIESLRRAVAIAPTSAKALNSLGAALLHRASAGDIDEAVDYFNRAIAARPDYPQAVYNLGAAMMAQKRHDEAIALFRRAIELQPGFPEAHSNLGHELQAAGRLDEAIVCYRRAIELNPGLLEGQINLGSALWSRGRLNEAQSVLSGALQKQPENAEALSNLGIVQLELGAIDEAIANLRQAVKLRPDAALILDNLGVVLRDQGHTSEAIGYFEQVIAKQPEDPKAYHNIGAALTDIGRIDDAIPYYRKAIERGDRDAASNLLLSMHYSPRVGPEEILAEARLWARQVEPSRKLGPERYANTRNPDKRLRVGFVSADFRVHSVTYFLMPLVQSVDPRQIELAFYSNRRLPDKVTGQYRAIASLWRDIVGLSNSQAADQIRHDAVDILVDLSGHSADNRLRVMAEKPAPVQVSMIGYGGTTGLESIQYRLTDAWADPPGMTESHFSEQLVRLSPTNWCYDPPRDSPPVRREPYASCESEVTFGSVNTYAKVSGAALDDWARILHAVPRSRILLKAVRLGSPEARESAFRGFESRGIARDRVEIRGAVRSLAAHLEVYRDIDIALDPFPYAGTTTTCETIWMGVPVVTREGDTHISRVGVSLLNNLGLPELIGRDSDDYVKIAVELAGDGQRLAELRGSMRARMSASPLMDKGAYARAVESAFRWMWRQWCESPAGPAT